MLGIYFDYGNAIIDVFIIRNSLPYFPSQTYSGPCLSVVYFRVND